MSANSHASALREAPSDVRHETTVTFIRELWIAYLAWRARTAAIGRLHAMSDRQLKDIGMSRGAIEHDVRHGREVDAEIAPGWGRRSAGSSIAALAPGRKAVS